MGPSLFVAPVEDSPPYGRFRQEPRHEALRQQCSHPLSPPTAHASLLQERLPAVGAVCGALLRSNSSLRSGCIAAGTPVPSRSSGASPRHFMVTEVGSPKEGTLPQAAKLVTEGPSLRWNHQMRNPGSVIAPAITQTPEPLRHPGGVGA